MPLIERMKALFSRKGDNEKKIAFLSERRASLSQQRDQAYEEMGDLEAQGGRAAPAVQGRRRRHHQAADHQPDCSNSARTSSAASNC